MNASNHTVCVLRSINGSLQLVAARGRTDLINNEPTTVGIFTSFDERTGPSGSHIVPCYIAVGRTYKSTLDINEFRASSVSDAARGIMKSCVARLVGKQFEFVDARGRNDLIEGEQLTSGLAVESQVKSGPSGSHSVTVQNFVGKIHRGVVPSNPSVANDLEPTLLFVPAGMLLSGQTIGHQAQA